MTKIRAFKKVSDYYLGIKIFENGTYEEIFNGPGNVIATEYSHRKGFERFGFLGGPLESHDLDRAFWEGECCQRKDG